VLDADELKVALRSTLGVDLSRADCEQLVAAADKDGTETIDFDEFRQICHGML
jgi:Ca2+-binding EF-hand superfamily protein